MHLVQEQVPAVRQQPGHAVEQGLQPGQPAQRPDGEEGQIEPAQLVGQLEGIALDEAHSLVQPRRLRQTPSLCEVAFGQVDPHAVGGAETQHRE